MKISHIKLKISIIVLLPIALCIREYLYYNPSITESYYSRLFYIPIGKLLSRVTGIFPFSLAEFLSIAAVACIVFLVLRLLYKLLVASNKLHVLLQSTVNAMCIISIVYCLFLLLWGYNYYRQPLAYSIGYRVDKSSVADLEKLCEYLIDKTNSSRAGLEQNKTGIMNITGGYKNVAARSDQGYKALAQAYPFFRGVYGKPKGVALSRQLSYTGIAGMYFPFTGEANVNTLVPDPLLPSTVCHEMAHQRGFAREDEANYIAYLACKAHKDSDFQYSGYLLAAIYSMNALHQYDLEGYNRLSAKYSEAVLRDLKYNHDFWLQFEGPAEELQERINDAYLKSNKQTDGVYSYGRMVDLLLAEFKSVNK